MLSTNLPTNTEKKNYNPATGDIIIGLMAKVLYLSLHL